MKFTATTLLSFLAALFSFLAATQATTAPEVTVYWHNVDAPKDACSAAELEYIDGKIEQDLDMYLALGGYEATTWETSGSENRRGLRDLQGSPCERCLLYYWASLCNAIFNCGFRRQLSLFDDEPPEELATDLQSMCQDNLGELATRTALLTDDCRSGLAGAECTVEFM